MYIEVRLLQQDQTTSRSIQEQLETGNIYQILKDGDDERQDVIRVQQAILGKVQKKDGTPIKFTTRAGAINIVAIDISQIILATFDSHDCKLVALGDPSVASIYQRGIFGLFQEPVVNLPEYIQPLAKTFAHIRNTIHGVLFVFKDPRSELFDYSVSRFLVWNPGLIDKETAKAICAQIDVALPLTKKAKK